MLMAVSGGFVTERAGRYTRQRWIVFLHRSYASFFKDIVKLMKFLHGNAYINSVKHLYWRLPSFKMDFI